MLRLEKLNVSLWVEPFFEPVGRDFVELRILNCGGGVGTLQMAVHKLQGFGPLKKAYLTDWRFWGGSRLRAAGVGASNFRRDQQSSMSGLPINS